MHILASDGSQIFPDPHASIYYSLINVAVFHREFGAASVPEIEIHTRFLSGSARGGQSFFSEETVALTRDLAERLHLADYAERLGSPLVAILDGPAELWGYQERDFRDRLESYLQLLHQLYNCGTIFAGYIDRPFSNLVVRLLEVAEIPEPDLIRIPEFHPLAGASDRALFSRILPPGHRSAVFSIQSRSASAYPDPIALHFFYLNVSQGGAPHVVRVEVPAWVVLEPKKLNDLHAVLIAECSEVEGMEYPYCLARAHEEAVLGHRDRELVNALLLERLWELGRLPAGKSAKQHHKDLFS